MFIRENKLCASDEAITFDFEGQVIEARLGDTVASALLLAGVRITRTTPISGASRAPYCMMGTCFECLMTIDGQPDRQACLIMAKDGMKVQQQLMSPGSDHD
jgi:uncharacterized metal-binding protein